MWCRLGTLCDYGVCQSASPDEISADSWVLDLEDIEKDTGTLLQRIKKCHRPTTSNKHIFKAGNVLYSKLRTYLNKVLIADTDGYCTSEILPLDFGEYILAVYARHVLMSKMFLDYTAQCGYGVKMPRLGTRDGRKALFPIPPLAEQQRIVAQIETLLDYVDIIDTDAETLEKSITRAKQKILDLAIRGKLVPQDPSDEPVSELLKKIKAEKDALIKAGKLKKDKHESFIFKSDDNCYHENIDGKVTDITDEIPFEIPDSWFWCRLNILCSILNGDRGQNYPAKSSLSPVGIPFVSALNIEKGKILKEKLLCLTQEQFSLLRAGKFQRGDILLCIRGSLGKYAIVNDEIGAIASSLVILRPLVKQNFSIATIIAYWIESQLFTSEMRKYDNGTAQPNLAAADLSKFLFPFPPLAEQKRIVSQVEKLFSVLETMRG